MKNYKVFLILIVLFALIGICLSTQSFVALPEGFAFTPAPEWPNEEEMANVRPTLSNVQYECGDGYVNERDIFSWSRQNAPNGVLWESGKICYKPVCKSGSVLSSLNGTKLIPASGWKLKVWSSFGSLTEGVCK